MRQRELAATDPLGVAVITTIRDGDIADLERLLDRNHDLARVWITSHHRSSGIEARSLLHVATDWAGRRPSGANLVRVLVAAGADVNAA